MFQVPPLNCALGNSHGEPIKKFSVHYSLVGLGVQAPLSSEKAFYQVKIMYVGMSDSAQAFCSSGKSFHLSSFLVVSDYDRRGIYGFHSQMILSQFSFPNHCGFLFTPLLDV